MDNTIEKMNFLSLTNAEELLVHDLEQYKDTECVKFSMADLSALGGIFSSLPAAFSGVVQASKGNKVLYEAILPVAGQLAEKDGCKLGAIMNKGIVGQARFKEVKNVAHAASGAGTMFMALAIMAVNKALKNVSENQKMIINFLEIDKQTQQKGDLIVLSDIIEEYQYNWNNEQYRANREMQILDIKRASEQNILFYREVIDKQLNKKSFIHIETKKTLNDVQMKFKYYKLALYLYAFASFLDILLLENFESAYLDSVVNKIEQYSIDYNSFYQKSMENIEKYASSSLQARAVQGLAVAGKFAGEQIRKIPDKDNKMKLDDKLISGSAKLDEFKSVAISQTVDSFSFLEDCGIKMFSEKISFINRLYNRPLRFVFDEENIYVPFEKSAV